MPDSAREKVSRVMPSCEAMRCFSIGRRRVLARGLAWRIADEIAADPLLGGAELQVLRLAHLAAELDGQTAQDGAAQRVIGRHRPPESLGPDQKQVRLLVDAGAHQIGLAADDRRGNERDRPGATARPASPGRSRTPRSSMLPASRNWAKDGDLRLLEQQAAGRHPMQQRLGRQRIQCLAPEPRAARRRCWSASRVDAIRIGPVAVAVEAAARPIG